MGLLNKFKNNEGLDACYESNVSLLQAKSENNRKWNDKILRRRVLGDVLPNTKSNLSKQLSYSASYKSF